MNIDTIKHEIPTRVSTAPNMKDDPWNIREAVICNDLNRVSACLKEDELGFWKNDCDSFGAMLLDTAIINGHLDIVYLLIQYGALDLPRVQRLFRRKAQNGDDMIDLLLTPTHEAYSLHLAIFHEHEQLALQIMDYYKKNNRSFDADLCLKIAADRGLYSVVKYLVRAGCNVNATFDFMKETALCYAIKGKSFKHYQIASFLIHAGTTIYQNDSSKPCVLSQACYHQNNLMVLLLLTLGVSPQLAIQNLRSLTNQVLNLEDDFMSYSEPRAWSPTEDARIRQWQKYLTLFNRPNYQNVDGVTLDWRITEISIKSFPQGVTGLIIAYLERPSMAFLTLFENYVESFRKVLELHHNGFLDFKAKEQIIIDPLETMPTSKKRHLSISFFEESKVSDSSIIQYEAHSP